MKINKYIIREGLYYLHPPHFTLLKWPISFRNQMLAEKSKNSAVNCSCHTPLTNDECSLYCFCTAPNINTQNNNYFFWFGSCQYPSKWQVLGYSKDSQFLISKIHRCCHKRESLDTVLDRNYLSTIHVNNITK
jgi:hypothetical protein